MNQEGQEENQANFTFDKTNIINYNIIPFNLDR